MHWLLKLCWLLHVIKSSNTCDGNNGSFSSRKYSFNTPATEFMSLPSTLSGSGSFPATNTTIYHLLWIVHKFNASRCKITSLHSRIQGRQLQATNHSAGLRAHKCPCVLGPINAWSRQALIAIDCPSFRLLISLKLFLLVHFLQWQTFATEDLCK